MIKSDDIKAFDQLFHRYWSLIYKNLFFYISDEELCAEIVQDIFLTIWQKRSTLQIISFRQYLNVAARHHLFKKLKTRNSKTVSYIDSYETVAHAVAPNDAEERLSASDAEYQLALALNKVPKRSREIFVMSRRDQLTNKEIAEQLGISKRSVENQITSVLKFLRTSFVKIAKG